MASRRRRIAALVAAAGALAACAVWHVGTKVTKRHPAPVPVVSLELRADSVLQEDPVDPRSVENLRTALATALLRHGITVVSEGQGGAPALIGDIETFYEGDDGSGFEGYGMRRGLFRIAWRLVDPNGAVLGRCVTDADSGLGAGAVYYSDVLDRAGAELAAFLLEAKPES